MQTDRLRALTMTVPWNLFLLTVSGCLAGFATICVAKPQGFVSGGLSGVAMLVVYATETLDIAVWYFLFNIPVLLLGWKFLSRRFMLYTIYCICVTALATQFMPFGPLEISDKMLAAVAAGVLYGAGSGIAIRSLGSDGGTTVISLILNQKFNLRVGSFSIAFNAVLFLSSLPVIGVDNVLYSMIITYLTSSLMNYFMGMFDERKLVFIISEHYEAIGQSILHHLGRGCTVLHGQGAYTRQQKEVILTVVHNVQLKRLEELVYLVDPQAFVIIENTHLVLGKGFSRRKRY